MVPKLDELKSVVGELEGVQPFKSLLPYSVNLSRRNSNGQRSNCLSGSCAGLSNRIGGLIVAQLPIEMRYVVAHMHNFLETDTSDAGPVIIDSTLGQFIVFPHIFTGTRDQLRRVFTDQANELLVGRRLCGIDHDILTRDEWFGLLWTPRYVNKFVPLILAK